MKKEEVSSVTAMLRKKETPPTDLGTAEIHHRHKVMIEGGQVPRAKVLDQCVIDKMLMAEDKNKSINLSQHQAGEFLLAQASAAGIYCATSKMDGMPSGVAKKSFVPVGIFPLSRTLRLVVKSKSEFHAYLVQEVVCQNWDVSDDPEHMIILRESLDVISEGKMAGGMNPSRHIRKVR